MKDQKEVEEYLAKIRQTITQSENLIAEAELRMAETDRFLESQGLTREQVLSLMNEYDAMRQTEGRRLCEDILHRGELIGSYVDFVEKRSPESVEEYRARIAQRMTEILDDVDVAQQKILSEAALFADKVSVTEEIVRLRSHLKQLHAMVSGDAAVGRKLDFLVQELNRESNTIGSKANDLEMTREVIDVKAEIEKIREQIQNLE